MIFMDCYLNSYLRSNHDENLKKKQKVQKCVS